jgi:hypothetical protein
VEVIARLGSFGASLLLDRLRGLGDSNVPERAAQVRDLLCVLGPTYIKAGQVLSSRPDIVRADYMEELATLQDDVPAFASAQAYRIIEEELGGKTLEEIFECITPRPARLFSLSRIETCADAPHPRRSQQPAWARCTARGCAPSSAVRRWR